MREHSTLDDDQSIMSVLTSSLNPSDGTNSRKPSSPKCNICYCFNGHNLVQKINCGWKSQVR